MDLQDLPTLSFDDLQKHNSNTDCWLAVHSKIYDVTDFLDEHPGGSYSPSARLQEGKSKVAYKQ